MSYDLPNEGADELYEDYSMGGAGSGRSSIGGNDYGSGQIDPQPENQSTPKKPVPQKSQRFTTKVEIFVDSR